MATQSTDTVVIIMEKVTAEKYLCDLLNSLDNSIIEAYKDLIEDHENKRKSARSKLFAAGENPDTATINDYKAKGYDLAAALTAERAQCTNIISAIKTKGFDVNGWRWETDAKSTESDSHIEIHWQVELSLVPVSGNGNKTYKAYINPVTVATAGNNRWLTNVSNPGDSFEQIPSGGGADSTSVTVSKPKGTLDSKRNAEMAAKNPERTVEGIYYESDEELEKARSAYESRVRADIASGKTEGTAAASKLAQAMQTVNTTLYGENSSETVAVMSGAVGNLELNGILGNAISVRERQKLLDWNKFKTDFKAPNAGKPPNNRDPFPVDQKIMELEVHQPTVKIDEILTHVHGSAAAAACLQISNFTEQRLVRLENNMATILRYLYRIGSRMFVNCIYYGGQTTFEKYSCIRCLKDDRAGDAANVQLDQCLTCTRYEPIYGQVYEILNGLGANVAQILDDNSMSYMNNDDYLRFSRTEEYQTNLKSANFDLTKVLKDQNNDSAGYDDLWGAGITMNWTKVPLEEQRCHINWRRSINDDGIALSSTLLASWMEQGGSINGGNMGGVSLSSTNNNIPQANIYEENQEDMSKGTHQNNEDYGEYIKAAIQFAKDKREKGEHLVSSDHETIKKLLGNNTDLDAFAVVAAAVALDKETDYASVINTYKEYATSLGTNNPVLVWTAVGGSEEIVKAYLNGTLDSDGNISPSTVTPKKASIPVPVIKETNLQMFTDIKAHPGDLNPSDVYRITVHHLGGGFDKSAAKIHEEHHYKADLDKCGIGYHYVIRWDGTIERGRPENLFGSHTGPNKYTGLGGNAGNIGINVSGTWLPDGVVVDGVDNAGHPEPSEAQISSLISLIADICRRYPGIKVTREFIRGHEEWYSGIGNTGYGCPGPNLAKRLDSIVQAVANGSLAQTVKLWTQFAAIIKKGMENKGTVAGDLSLFPKICFLYVALEASAATTVSESLDSTDWGFPFSDEDIKKYGNGTMNITGLFKEIRQYSSGPGPHHGVDLQPAGMAPAEGDPLYRTPTVPVRAMNDGTVINATGSCNDIYIQHKGGYFSGYLHCNNLRVSVGDTVKRGDIIAYMSGVGPTGIDHYPYHLHVEMGKGDNINSIDCKINPVEHWGSKATIISATDVVRGYYKI